MKADLIDRRLLSELVDAHGNVHWEDIAKIPNEQSEITICKDCKHKPTLDEDGEPDFPTNRCPCQCDDYYYSWMPKDDWFCGNAERREE